MHISAPATIMIILPSRYIFLTSLLLNPNTFTCEILKAALSSIILTIRYITTTNMTAPAIIRVVIRLFILSTKTPDALSISFLDVVE